MHTLDRGARRRVDASRNRRRIIEAATRLFKQSPAATLADIAAAAGVSRSTLYRNFRDRQELIGAIDEHSDEIDLGKADDSLPAGRLGRKRPVPLEAIDVFDAVPPPVLPDQLVAEAQKIANVVLALYVIDIDGSHLLRVAGSPRLPDRLDAPLAVGPELDADGLAALRDHLRHLPGAEIIPLWLRGRATGVMIALGRPANSLAELARQAAAAVTLADRYTDAFARATRRKQPTAAAEIQQSLLPPRIARISGGEVAGNIIPSYEVAGDWFDVVENADGVWVTLADGVGEGTRAAASSSVALGALRASRRSGATISEAMMVMHQTLREMPGPRAEMSAVATHWDPASHCLTAANCGHLPQLVIRSTGRAEQVRVPRGSGLGGRASPKPREVKITLEPGDRLVLFSDGVVEGADGAAQLGIDGVIEAALRSERATAAETVRKIHAAVLDANDQTLQDDATVVCLSLS